MSKGRLLGSLLVAIGVSGVAWPAPQQAGYENPPINYSGTPAADAVAELNARIARGEVPLPFEAGHGYLRAVLDRLGIPLSSQSLVFSKTSFQRQWITPHSPRALYFNDEVYIGWVQGAEVLEVASIDPGLGTVFYTLPQQPAKLPRFLRQTDQCLQCHDSASLALGIPGVTIRSVFPGPDGLPRFNLGGYRTTYRSPIDERWGGWYVSGEHGRQRHLGNLTFPDEPNPEARRLEGKGANLTDLSTRIDVEPYLTATSDIVALMVLEYQTTVHNLIIRANHETRVAILQNDDVCRAEGLPVRPLTEGTRRRIQYACEPLVEALLYSGEARLTDPVKGTSTFAADFEKRGPFDRSGRSLRQFDLHRRMFKYPLSYLIYSRAFAGLPQDARDYVRRRLGEVLLGKKRSKAFDHLSTSDREATVEIVRDTLPELASGWK